MCRRSPNPRLVADDQRETRQRLVVLPLGQDNMIGSRIRHALQTPLDSEGILTLQPRLIGW